MINNIKNFLGLTDEEYDDEYEVYDPDAEETDFAPPEVTQYESRDVPASNERDFYKPTKSKKGEKSVSNVVGMPGITNSNAEVSVITPRSFEEMPEVIQALRERKSVILNLNMMNPEEAQRAVDFVSGGTYAMDGQYERVGESIFLFTPSCVKVSTRPEIMDDLTNSNNPSRVRRPAPYNTDYLNDLSAVGQ
ncbi:MAG: cell division protein SepF [Xenococcaceae cyanobacterium MO_207.B15]|nr:cell division protein SepF [Xenococcaceae cyanobacterium MO_207.B15]MDJ0744630.1 cell division protein SepF [Xenococcaceae cyanobacterium MO_167.B27]